MLKSKRQRKIRDHHITLLFHFPRWDSAAKEYKVVNGQDPVRNELIDRILKPYLDGEEEVTEEKIVDLFEEMKRGIDQAKENREK